MDNLKEWTLFLDRDGVINRKVEEHQYISSIGEFSFLPNALDAIRILSGVFGHIVVVTNQQGIAKGELSLDDLSFIHSYMIAEVEKSGGRIDGVFFCPHLEMTCECRKPKIGLANEAKLRFHDIDLKRSFVVGDSYSDVNFANDIGAIPILAEKETSLFDFAMTFVKTYDMGVVAGSFDVIHPGYIEMLEEAKKVCDYLLVLLHDDPSRENPLKPKPVLSLQERREILLAIKYVDEVYEYKTEEELAEIISELPPHIRILGDDYKDKKYTGESPFVHYCARGHGWSSTKLKKMIAESMKEYVHDSRIA